ncbi:MAG: phosphotransferase [Paludibaculum sp.]
MIPQEKQEAVLRGLQAAFGVPDFEEISVLTGGHTNSLVYRIVVGGKPYVLKIIVRAEDPTRHYACMTAAAEAGIAPRVWYASTEDRLAITDFVRAEPLAVPDALVRLPGVLRTLHALAPFARAPFNTTCTFLLGKGPLFDSFLQRFLASNALPEADLREWSARLAELSAVYPYEDGEMVSSHKTVLQNSAQMALTFYVGLCGWRFLSGSASPKPSYPLARPVCATPSAGRPLQPLVSNFLFSGFRVC